MTSMICVHGRPYSLMVVLKSTSSNPDLSRYGGLYVQYHDKSHAQSIRKSHLMRNVERIFDGKL
ncbi:hypothetical protein DJ84_13975 [Halorubrum ezzemoulense]|nr:hypothetical protein DJ84_13975 [Halorubrum ezzemoulense]